MVKKEDYNQDKKVSSDFELLGNKSKDTAISLIKTGDSRKALIEFREARKYYEKAGVWDKYKDQIVPI